MAGLVIAWVASSSDAATQQLRLQPRPAKPIHDIAQRDAPAADEVSEVGDCRPNADVMLATGADRWLGPTCDPAAPPWDKDPPECTVARAAYEACKRAAHDRRTRFARIVRCRPLIYTEASTVTVVTARLIQRTNSGGSCGMAHFVETMGYRVVHVESGEVAGEIIAVDHGCPEMPRSSYGANAGTLERFELGALHRLELAHCSRTNEPTLVMLSSGTYPHYRAIKTDAVTSQPSLP